MPTPDLNMPPSESLWSDGRLAPARTQDMPASSSVVVVGAGVSGLVTAAMLVEHGVDVTVIDSRERADSVTARSSAKVSVLHELTAAKIARTRGDSVAEQYVTANAFGVEWIARSIIDLGIDCSWERRDAITYVHQPSSVGKLRQDVALLRRAGVDAEETTDVGLPFDVLTAIRVPEQGQFDPLAYIDGLATSVVAAGAVVAEGVRATGIDHHRGGVTVRTGGGEIEAGHVVIATGLPFLDRGFHFARCEPQSSYVVVCATESAPAPGMYLSADGPKRSVRSARTADGTDVLLVGGEGHKTGQGGDTEQNYAALAEWADEHFGVRSITHRFMAQDYTTPDHVPFAGPILPGESRVLIATGMNKWGFSNSVAAAAVNVAHIVGGDRPTWTEAYRSTRLPLAGLADVIKTNGNVAAHMVGGWASVVVRRSTPNDGAGHVALDGVRPTATSADRCGAVRAVGGVCPHLGGILAWNPAEQTWDCPLHGSRFERDGRLLHGPATADLADRTAT